MELNDVMQRLEALGNEQTKRTLMKHGAKEPFFGVKVGDMKPIQKAVKKDHNLALALFATRNGDAQYLAGLIADEKKMSKDDLRQWAESATWQMVSEYSVAWAASESPHGWALGLEWIDDPQERIASAGWCTLAGCLALYPDDTLDHAAIRQLLHRVRDTIHQEQNRVRYTMNGFVIAVGTYYLPLSEEALQIARQIGKVHVDQGGTACKVPEAPEYITAALAKGQGGKKRKTVRC